MRVFNKKFVLVISILFASTIVAGCKTNSKDNSLAVQALSPPGDVQGQIYKVKTGSISNLLVGNGTLISGKTQQLAFHYNGGVIKSINAQAGSTVKKGDILAELDTDELTTEIKIQELKVKKAQLSYDEIASEKPDDISLQQSSLEVQQQQLQLDILNQDLDKCKIIAPFNGVISEVSKASVGAHIGTSPLFVLDSTETFMVKCDDKNSQKYRVGMKAKFKCDVNVYDGEVVSIGNVNVNDNTTYSILKLSATPNAKYYKATGLVSIEISKKDNVIVVPKSYLNSTSTYSYVNVVKNNIKEQRYVVKGLESDDNVEIVSGLEDGEEITDN